MITFIWVRRMRAAAFRSFHWVRMVRPAAPASMPISATSTWNKRSGRSGLFPALHGQRGFTLIEVLIVLLIIGVIVGLAALAFRDNRADELAREAQRLRAVLALASEEAIVKSRELGLRFDADGYRFFVLD